MSTSATDYAIVDVEGEAASAPGRDRRGAMAVAFALCLAIGSAAVGRDGPEATVAVEPSQTLVLSQHGDVVLFAFPDRLANEPLPNLNYLTVTVRGTEGLAVNTGERFIQTDIKWIDGRTDAQPPVRGWPCSMHRGRAR